MDLQADGPALSGHFLQVQMVMRFEKGDGLFVVS